MAQRRKDYACLTFRVEACRGKHDMEKYVSRKSKVFLHPQSMSQHSTWTGLCQSTYIIGIVKRYFQCKKRFGISPTTKHDASTLCASGNEA